MNTPIRSDRSYGNKQKITEKRAELSELIEQLDQAIEAYEVRIKEMMR